MKERTFERKIEIQGATGKPSLTWKMAFEMVLDVCVCADWRHR